MESCDICNDNKYIIDKDGRFQHCKCTMVFMIEDEHPLVSSYKTQKKENDIYWNKLMSEVKIGR